MKFTALFALAVAAVLSTGAEVVEAKAKTKKIAMNGDIVPTWETVIPKALLKSTKKVTLKTVQRYWAKLEDNDVAAYTALFRTKLQKLKAKAEVRAFYDQAEACLRKHKLKTRYTKAKFTSIMATVRTCIHGKINPPVFDVDDSATPAPTKPVPVDDPDNDGDDGGDDDDNDDDNTGALPLTNTPTMAPTAAPISDPTGAPAYLPTDAPTTAPTDPPAVVPSETPTELPTYTPTEMPPTETPTDAPTPIPDYVPIPDDVDTAAPSSYAYKPSSPIVAPFWALDVDHNDVVTSDEWTEYAARLRDVALERIHRGWDATAVALLQQATEFHYAILNQCIQVKLAELGVGTLRNDAIFAKFHDLVQSECYVKWRYSLLSGPPPFELIAKKETVITPDVIENWLTRKVQVAKHDIGVKKIFEVTEEEQKQLEHILECTHQVFGAVGERPIDREVFYGELGNIESCVKSYTTR